MEANEVVVHDRDCELVRRPNAQGSVRPVPTVVFLSFLQSRASSSDENSGWFKYFSRKRPGYESLNASFVCFPGRLKSNWMRAALFLRKMCWQRRCS